MAGRKVESTVSTRIKAAMQRPEVQAKLHAPRKKKFDQHLLETLRTLLRDPTTCAELRELLFADGRFRAVNGLGEKEEVTPAPSWAHRDPKLTAITNHYAAAAAATATAAAASSQHPPRYWWYRRNASNQAIWIDGTPGFHTQEAAHAWAKECAGAEMMYLFGPFTHPYSVIDNNAMEEMARYAPAEAPRFKIRRKK